MRIAGGAAAAAVDDTLSGRRTRPCRREGAEPSGRNQRSGQPLGASVCHAVVFFSRLTDLHRQQRLLDRLHVEEDAHEVLNARVELGRADARVGVGGSVQRIVAAAVVNLKSTKRARTHHRELTWFSACVRSHQRTWSEAVCLAGWL